MKLPETLRYDCQYRHSCGYVLEGELTARGASIQENGVDPQSGQLVIRLAFTDWHLSYVDPADPDTSKTPLTHCPGCHASLDLTAQDTLSRHALEQEQIATTEAALAEVERILQGDGKGNPHE